jgi:hypothetical protein
MELWESLVLPRFYKRDVVKTRQASHGLTETRQKGHWKMMLYQGGGREKYMVGKLSMDLLILKP